MEIRVCGLGLEIAVGDRDQGSDRDGDFYNLLIQTKQLFNL